MPTKRLPPGADIAHLKVQARDLLKALADRDPQAAQRVREFHPAFHGAADAAIFEASLKLSGAQLAIAREYGFASWPRLKRRVETPAPDSGPGIPHHERIQDAEFRHAVDLLDAGDAAGLRAYLHARPDLVHRRVAFEGENYFRNPSLLEFTAENPIRRGTLPANIAEMVQVILEAGARTDPAAVSETLGLVCSGRVARECGVQLVLVDVLCAAGADPNYALPPALAHGEFAAVSRLLERGAALSLPVAAALGRTEDAARLLAVSSAEQRHAALALAAQFGHAEIVRLLLDAGEPADRYNPVGNHAHSTPLHQAALAGHMAVVRLLVDRGARLDLKDTLFQGTAADWARHAGKTDIERYLLAHA